MRVIKKAVLLILFLAAAHGPERSQGQPPEAPKPPKILPFGAVDVKQGEVGEIKGEGLPDKKKYQVAIRKAGEEPSLAPASKPEKENTVRYTAPNDLPPGRYLVAVRIEGEEQDLEAGELRVL